MCRVLGFGLTLGLMFFGLVTYADGQEKQRVISDIYLPKDAPVQIIDRELEGRKFEDRKLDNRISGRANSDWIKHLTLVVKNVSKKNISYLRITLTVPQQKQMPGPMIYEVSFGDRNGTDGFISPGEAARIRVRDDDFLFWERRFKDWGVDDFDHVFLELRTIYFDDGTGWSLGRDIVRDPPNPKNWVHVEKAEPNGKSFTCLLRDLLQPIRLDAGFFFTSASPVAVVCGWGEEDSNIGECQGCTNPVDQATCDQFNDDIFHLQPTGEAPEGFLTENVQQNCRSQSPGTSDCGSCPPSGYTRDRFTRFTNCGQPQTCGNISTWGCVSPLVDVNGICQRSLTYQTACPAGYDGLACECRPVPTPTPTPPPPPPTPDPSPSVDPCDGDECCGRGTHTECTDGYCEPSFEVCWRNPYTGQNECRHYPGECEPEVCN